MDSLLEKLRAAAPQAKDVRDRRRRARLKERHQVRVASGQKVPDLSGADGGEGSDQAGDAAPTDENDLLSPPTTVEGEEGTKEQISEGEDVADRAASMLLGLRSNSDASGERQRRRRESADEERRQRRMRRRNGATTGSKDSADGSGSGLAPVQEPTSPSQTDSFVGAEDQPPLSSHPDEAKPSAPPEIVVSEQHDDGLSETKPQADGSSASHPIELSD